MLLLVLVVMLVMEIVVLMVTVVMVLVIDLLGVQQGSSHTPFSSEAPTHTELPNTKHVASSH